MTRLGGVCALMVLTASLSTPAAGNTPLHQCPWREVRTLDKEDLADYRDRLLASKFYRDMPLNANTLRWRELFEKKDFTAPQQLAVYLEEFMKERGWPPEIRAMVLKLKPGAAIDVLEDRFGVTLDILDRVAKRKNPDEMAMIVAQVLDPNRPARQDANTAIFVSAKLFHLPVATSQLEPLNKGTGNSSYVYKGELPDKTQVALKVQKDEMVDSETPADERKLRTLAELGGAKSYGLVRVKDEHGRWRPATAIELVPGKDLLTLDNARRQSFAPPLMVSEAHLKAMEALVGKVERNGWVLDDIMPGDFMLTPDGKVVPLDMNLRKTGTGDTWEKEQRTTSALLRREVLERLYQVYEAQHHRPAPRGLPPRG